jgi:hypothetical protein
LADDKKKMAKNWMNGQKRFLTGKTFAEDFSDIKSFLMEANASRKNKLYVQSG